MLRAHGFKHGFDLTMIFGCLADDQFTIDLTHAADRSAVVFPSVTGDGVFNQLDVVAGEIRRRWVRIGIGSLLWEEPRTSTRRIIRRNRIIRLLPEQIGNVVNACNDVSILFRWRRCWRSHGQGHKTGDGK